MMHAFCYTLILLALAAILFEDKIHLSKAKSTLLLGTLGWIALWIFPQDFGGRDHVRLRFEEELLGISSLWLFLVATMTFVAYLNKQGFIEALIYRWLPSRMSLKKLMLFVGLFAFAFSSLADNITATLVCLSLILTLPVETAAKLRCTVLAVFAINSGGVALITGDVTTLMIFLAGKLPVADILLLGLPALGGVLVLYALLQHGMTHTVTLTPRAITLRGRDWVVAGIFLLTLTATISGSLLFSIPPLLVFLFGLSVMFMAGWWLGISDEGDWLDYVRVIEFETLFFFLGVLLLVGLALELGALDVIPALYANHPAMMANYLMGLMSALIDNVPMTAALLKSGVTMDDRGWFGLTYAIGVGGSLLVIGSAAGIVAMSKMRELTFTAYLRFCPQVLLAYSTGYGLACLLSSQWQ
ncbi:MAG: sodium:proton antiporter [Gammaproteobacteria bacterium]|nr:MAG: sodium:proton antiporter [Gammaproteobacteria bacterium]